MTIMGTLVTRKQWKLMTAEIKGEDFTRYFHIFMFLMRECLKDKKNVLIKHEGRNTHYILLRH